MIQYQSQNGACNMTCLHVISAARMPLSEGAFFYEFSLQSNGEKNKLGRVNIPTYFLIITNFLQITIKFSSYEMSLLYSGKRGDDCSD